MKDLNPKKFPTWVLDALVNDGYSSDEDIVQIFMQEEHVTEEQARTWVAERGYYGGNGYFEDQLANAEEYRAKREAMREREKRALAKLVANG